MTLAIALLTQGTELPQHVASVCTHLQRTVPETVDLVLLTTSPAGAAAPQLIQLAESSHAQYVELSQPDCTPETACAVARRLTGAPYVLFMQPHDRLAARALLEASDWLNTTRPELALMAGAWWISEPRVDDVAPGLAFPDAERLAALPDPTLPQHCWALTPDPRRLMLAQKELPHIDPFTNPAAAWNAWESTLHAQTTPSVFTSPVLLRPLPNHTSDTGAAPMLALMRTRLLGIGPWERPARLKRLASWLGDALTLSPPGAALAVLSELQALWDQLSPRDRSEVCALPHPVGLVFTAQAENQPLAALALLAAAHQERLTTALAADRNRLWADLDLAMPGPDYLADLYARIRGL